MEAPCDWLVHSVEVYKEESKCRKNKCWSGWNHFFSAKQHEILILCAADYHQNMLICSVTETQRSVKNRRYRKTLMNLMQENWVGEFVQIMGFDEPVGKNHRN